MTIIKKSMKREKKKSELDKEGWNEVVNVSHRTEVEHSHSHLYGGSPTQTSLSSMTP